MWYMGRARGVMGPGGRMLSEVSRSQEDRLCDSMRRKDLVVTFPETTRDGGRKGGVGREGRGR